MPILLLLLSSRWKNSKKVMHDFRISSYFQVTPVTEFQWNGCMAMLLHIDKKAPPFYMRLRDRTQLARTQKARSIDVAFFELNKIMSA
jgi:hypothetical protein